MISDKGIFIDLYYYFEGIKWVIVNGEIIVDGEDYIDVCVGMVFRGLVYN